ncbi:MAG: GNAT family N-acetyltransferase [Phycisphaerae bacterium]|nr:GNAT family N-acetyltransferase [Phycisphaerae bacterium]
MSDRLASAVPLDAAFAIPFACTGSIHHNLKAMWKIVPYSQEHRDGVVHVVKSVFDEYGFTWEADGYCRDIYDPHQTYIEPGGMFWCAVEQSPNDNLPPRVIGCAGVSFHDGYCELHRMYLLATCRGRGIGRALLNTCIEHARRSGSRAIRAWSDVKLADAHRLYLRAGFVRDNQRICDDPDQSPEFGFWKEPP